MSVDDTSLFISEFRFMIAVFILGDGAVMIARVVVTVTMTGLLIAEALEGVVTGQTVGVEEELESAGVYLQIFQLFHNNLRVMNRESTR